MTEVKHSHTAAQSAAGYLYQARFALAECLRFAYVDSDIEIAVERLDDISFERHGSPRELLQTKHHIKKSGNLTNSSVDLWKTLRAWAEATRSDPSLPRRTRFVLITTALAPDCSAASHLRPASNHSHRNVEKAEAILMDAAAASNNASLEKAFSVLTGLAPALRRTLLESIEILDRAPLIRDLDALIEQRLRMIGPRGKAKDARERLEGWWWPRICTSLGGDEAGTISIIELEQELDDIRDSLKRNALPLDMENIDLPDNEVDSLKQMTFVRQLHAVGIGASRLQYAMRDYYRAFTQRSRWIRLSLLIDGEVNRFEQTLIEEWGPRFSRMCESFSPDSTDVALRRRGDELYFWVESEARFPFRTITSRFLNVGSYHMLANDLRIGWHRDYQALLTEVESDVTRGS